MTDVFKEARDHLVRLAMTPGFWDYSRHRAMALEGESETHGHGLFRGIRQAVKEELQCLRFRPAPGELAQESRPCTPWAGSRPGR